MNRQNPVPNRKAASLEVAHAELAGSIARWTGEDNRLTSAIPLLTLHRWETPTEPTSYMLPPSICLIAHGALKTPIQSFEALH